MSPNTQPHMLICKSCERDLEDLCLLVGTLESTQITQIRLVVVAPSRTLVRMKSRLPNWVELQDEESLYNVKDLKWYEYLTYGTSWGGWYTQQSSKLLALSAFSEHTSMLLDSDSIVIKQLDKSLFTSNNLKVFRADNECTVTDDGFVKPTSHDPGFVYRLNSLSSSSWHYLMRVITTGRLAKQTFDSQDLIGLFGDLPYFNPMPSPIIPGSVAKAMSFDLEAYGLSFCDLIRISPHEYYWIFLYAASCTNLTLVQSPPHSVHIKEFDQLKYFCRRWTIEGVTHPAITSVVLSPRTMPLTPRQKITIAHTLQACV